ncbi:hypothetical protein BDQ12DRAFT_568547, partial [Crucibulum laeve]
TCIFHAATFLTYPLTTVFPAPALSALQTILSSTLHAAFLDCKSAEMSLYLSPSALPPRPIHAACIASGMSWSNWIAALGGGSFELCISPDEVLVKVDGIMQEHEISVWKQEKAHAEVPISKISRHVQLAPLRRGIQRRTLAQQLIESDEEETEEMFRMISSGMVSPTPTREMAQPRLLSLPSLLPVPTLQLTPPTPVAAVSTPSAPIIEDEEESSNIIIDTTRKPTAYLYQGGKSTVLTGGVMLGGASPS